MLTLGLWRAGVWDFLFILILVLIAISWVSKGKFLDGLGKSLSYLEREEYLEELLLNLFERKIEFRFYGVFCVNESGLTLMVGFNLLKLL